MLEVGRLVSGTDARVTLIATETLPEATLSDELERGDVLGVAASLFADTVGALKAGRRTSAHMFKKLRQELHTHLEEAARPLRDKASALIASSRLATWPLLSFSTRRPTTSRPLSCRRPGPEA